MTADVVVRPARRSDLPTVLDVWSAARSAHATSLDDDTGLRRLHDHDPSAVLVAECDGHVVGVLVAGWDGWRGNMYRLAVDAGHRRRGIAGELVRAGEARLRDLGAGRITALVATDDRPATALWEAAGYALDGAIGRFVRDV